MPNIEAQCCAEAAAHVATWLTYGRLNKHSNPPGMTVMGKDETVKQLPDMAKLPRPMLPIL
jgi:hypothetical protein